MNMSGGSYNVTIPSEEIVQTSSEMPINFSFWKSLENPPTIKHSWKRDIHRQVAKVKDSRFGATFFQPLF